jgi:hypothetical protein
VVALGAPDGQNGAVLEVGQVADGAGEKPVVAVADSLVPARLEDDGFIAHDLVSSTSWPALP